MERGGVFDLFSVSFFDIVARMMKMVGFRVFSFFFIGSLRRFVFFLLDLGWSFMGFGGEFSRVIVVGLVKLFNYLIIYFIRLLS